MNQLTTKLSCICWVIALTLASLGSTGCHKTSAQSEPEKNKGQTAVKSTLHLEGFVVNLADPAGNCFLRVGVDLGLNEEPAAEGKEKGPAPATAQIRDTIIGVLTRWQSESLLAPGGQTQLKHELLKALQERLPELGIVDVYLTDFLVQR